MINHDRNQELDLRKLGISEIQERLEVSPIIADPGSLGSGTDGGLSEASDGGGKHYECNIIKPEPTPPDPPDNTHFAIPGGSG